MGWAGDNIKDLTCMFPIKKRKEEDHIPSLYKIRETIESARPTTRVESIPCDELDSDFHQQITDNK